MAGYLAFGELAADAIRGGAALHLTDKARTVRDTEGTVSVTDGPFAETAETLGGYYILQAGHLGDVIEMVRHIPAPAMPGGGRNPSDGDDPVPHLHAGLVASAPGHAPSRGGRGRDAALALGPTGPEARLIRRHLADLPRRRADLLRSGDWRAPPPVGRIRA